MPRERSPKRDKAFEIWKASGGNKPLTEIGDILGVSATQIRKWKSIDKWDDHLKGNISSKKKRNDSKKKGNITEKKSQPKANRKIVNKLVSAAEENEELTEKQKLFCLYYVQSGHVPTSYLKAYNCKMSTARVEGYVTLAKPYIKAEIKRLQKVLCDAYSLPKERIENMMVERMLQIAFADMTDVAEWGTKVTPDLDANGDLQIDLEGNIKYRKYSYLEFKDYDKVDGGVISEISLTSQGMKVKLEDRQKAMLWLDNYFGFNPMHKHKQWYDKAILALREREVAIKEF